MKKRTCKGKEHILGLPNMGDEDFWKMSIWLFSGESEKGTLGGSVTYLHCVHMTVWVSNRLKTVKQLQWENSRIYI